VAANDLLEEMHGLLERVLGEHASLRIRTGPHLEKIRIYPGRFQQALLSLVMNAHDAMPQGGNLDISLSNLQLDQPDPARFPDAAPARYVLLKVSDTGLGMDTETRARIFKPFFTTKAEGKGTGLGLFTVHTIVKQCGGHIYVESGPGQGTTFTILFPALGEPEKTEHTKPTLLLVEDEELVRRSVDAALSMRGYKVLPAANAGEAMRISQNYSGRIELMVTDLSMPAISGTELAQEMHAARPEMKVLFVSGSGDDPRMQELDVKREDFFRKPFTPAALAHKIENLLNMHSDE